MLAHLDDLASMSRIDTTGMIDQLASFPYQLEDSLVDGHRRDVEAATVVVGGLGGSAMGGDVIAEYMALRSSAPTMVVRDTMLPNWVDESTLILIISYSGNTRETVSLYEAARERGGPMVIITSGGRIGQLAEDDGEEVVLVPSGLQPRAALGYLLGSAASVIESARLAPMASEIRSSLPRLKILLEDLRPQAEASRNIAKRIANRLVNTMPFVYAPASIHSAARRWKTQINENSKMLCLSGEIPEIDHNQIVGWIDGVRDDRNCPVILRPSSEEGMNARALYATIDLMVDSGLDPVIVDLEGDTPLANALHGIMIGDFVSYYLAMMREVDPLPVPAITELKKRLA